MRIESIGHYKRAIIMPGEFHVSTRPIVISTLLGSCVAACLFDRKRRIIGMNHFMLSGDTAATPLCLSTAGRYGIHAMELLINEMMRLGARRENLRAKVFGGSTLSELGDDSIYRVGENNSRFVVEFLNLEGIPIVARDLGGNHGRVVHFSHGDYAVYVRKLRSGHFANLARRDRECWTEALRKQESSLPDIEIWG